MPGALTHVGDAAKVKRRNLIGHVAQNDRPKNSTFSYDGASPMTPPTWQQIQTLPVEDIQVEERLRTASETAVASIVSSIQEVGSILQPLLVRRIKDGYRLLDGLHRLTAAKEAGLAEVPVKVSECTNDQAIRIEVDANVAGAPLTPLDMAVFLAAHKELYERENPETARGKAGAHGRWDANDKMSLASFTANAAETFGKSQKTMQRLISVGEKLSPSEIAQLRDAPQKVQFKDLEHIAKCGEQADRAAICAALGDGTAKSAKEVLDRKKAPGAALKTPVEQQFSKLADAFIRASKEARRQFVAQYGDILSELIEDAKGGAQV
ncbi:ParB N-terminal domain-containing protein [Phaeobacter inhibens]|uniref:ParB/RepB/Spo0J family partition protein n=1 Tax=Phaeobacter inhibens TaxID=221822 RepID=UPI0021A4294C|nr:ParB N-terminal domain-containing protein [Phaeobacter inhibens]UWR74832.1 ParB N-terminal domain-containing protein [Phaeobacter inhibens]